MALLLVAGGLAAPLLGQSPLRPVARGPAVAEAHLVGLPPRPRGALGGTAFLSRIGAMAFADREAAILAEVRRGNIPDFLRRLTPVHLVARPSRGADVRAEVWVMPDYLAVGSDEDFVRVPMSLRTAAVLARVFDATLPTTKVVDAIARQAVVRLEPFPLPAGASMRSVAYFARHDRQIEQARAGRPLGALTAGHKKDLVLTNRLRCRPEREAIYGWHRRSGRPIQPLSTVHGAGYVDYSHGLRLVSSVVLVNGAPRDVYDILADPDLAGVLTDEGPIASGRRLLSPPARGGSGTCGSM